MTDTGGSFNPDDLKSTFPHLAPPPVHVPGATILDVAALYALVGIIFVPTSASPTPTTPAEYVARAYDFAEAFVAEKRTREL